MSAGAQFDYSVGLDPTLPNPDLTKYFAHHKSQQIRLVLCRVSFRFGYAVYIYQTERGGFEFWVQEREPEAGGLLSKWMAYRGGDPFEPSPDHDEDWVEDKDWELIGNALAFWPADRVNCDSVSLVPERQVRLHASPGRIRLIG